MPPLKIICRYRKSCENIPLGKSLVSYRRKFSFRGKYNNPYSSLLVRQSAASRSIPQLLLPAKTMGAGKCHSLHGEVVRLQDQKSAASVIAKEALSFCQDLRNCCKFVLRWAVSPRGGDLCLDTKHLLSSIINIQRNTVPGSHTPSIKSICRPRKSKSCTTSVRF